MIKIRTFCSEEQRRIFITTDVIQRELHNSSPRTRVTPGGQTPNLFLFPLALFVHIAYVSSLMCSSCVLLSFISSWLLPLLLLIVFYLIWSICSLNLFYVFCCLTCLLLCLFFSFLCLSVSRCGWTVCVCSDSVLIRIFLGTCGIKHFIYTKSFMLLPSPDSHCRYVV